MCKYFTAIGVAVVAGVVMAVALRLFNVETGFNAGIAGVTGGVAAFTALKVGKGTCKTGNGENQTS
jgi:hypothetical protein